MAGRMKIPSMKQVGAASGKVAKAGGKLVGKTAVGAGAVAYGLGKTTASSVVGSVVGATGIGPIASKTWSNTKQGYNIGMAPFRTKEEREKLAKKKQGGQAGSKDVVDLLSRIATSSDTVAQNTSAHIAFLTGSQIPWMSSTTEALTSIVQSLQNMTSDSFRNKENDLEKTNTSDESGNNVKSTPTGTSGAGAALGALIGGAAGAAAATPAEQPGTLSGIVDGLEVGAGMALSEAAINSLRGAMLLKIGGVATAIVTAAIDGVSTAMQADKWDVRTVSAAVGGVIAGKDQEWSSMLSNAIKGGAAGSVVGSAVPLVGTLAGGLVGAVLGVTANLIGPEKIAKWTNDTVDAFAGITDLMFGKRNYFDPVELQRRVASSQAKIDQAKDDLITLNNQINEKSKELYEAQQSNDTQVVEHLKGEIQTLNDRKTSQQTNLQSMQSQLDQTIKDLEVSQTNYFENVRKSWQDLGDYFLGKRKDKPYMDLLMEPLVNLKNQQNEVRNGQQINRTNKTDRLMTPRDIDTGQNRDVRRSTPPPASAFKWPDNSDLILPFPQVLPVERHPLGNPTLPDHLRGPTPSGIFGNQRLGIGIKIRPDDDIELPMMGVTPVTRSNLGPASPAYPGEQPPRAGVGGMFRNEPIGLPFGIFPPNVAPIDMQNRAQGITVGPVRQSPVANDDRFSDPGYFEPNQAKIRSLQDAMDKQNKMWMENRNMPALPPVILKQGDTYISGGGGSTIIPSSPPPTTDDARATASPYERSSVYGDRFSIFDIIP